MMGKPLRDLTGQRFGFLVALCLGEKQRNDTGAWWLCRCDYGTEKNLPSHDLVGLAARRPVRRPGIREDGAMICFLACALSFLAGGALVVLWAVGRLP